MCTSTASRQPGAFKQVLVTAVFRGCTFGLPQERGNMLKVDRHNYVKLAYHGFKELTPDQRKVREEKV